VLPDGTLFGEGVQTRIKEQLLAECNLHTIVRLPNGVFAPYTGIKTNLLFFTKGQPTEHVWYYEHPYPAGVKNYNKTKPIRIEEFDAEKAWWGSETDGFATRVENERAWKVSIEQIKAANYNLDQKNPHAAEVVSHDPEQLLADYARLQTEAQSLRSADGARAQRQILGEFAAATGAAFRLDRPSPRRRGPPARTHLDAGRARQAGASRPER
jgi:type I restriction enzyme M protein